MDEHHLLSSVYTRLLVELGRSHRESIRHCRVGHWKAFQGGKLYNITEACASNHVTPHIRRRSIGSFRCSRHLPRVPYI